MTLSAVFADLAERSPADAVVGLKDLIERARDEGNDLDEAEALTELGRTRRALGHIDLAEHSLRAALECAPDGTTAAADAHLVLASILSLSGRNDDAFVHLGQAAGSSDPDLVRSAHLQRAVLLQRTGRLAAALEMYDRTLPDLRTEDRSSDIARVLANRGEIHARLGNRAQALADFRAAATLFGNLGQPLREAQTLQNVGWVHGIWGELPSALAVFDDVGERLQASRHDAGTVELSRAEALLAAGLDREAASVAERAVAPLLAAGCRVEAARGLLLAARATRDVDALAAANHARAAAHMFAEQEAESWRLTAEVEAHRAGPATSIGELESLIDELTALRLHSIVLTAHAVAATIAVEHGALDSARHHVGTATSLLADDTALDLRIDTLLAASRLADAQGDSARVITVTTSALDDIDERISTYGDGDARSAFRRRIQEFQTVAVRACIDLGDIGTAIDFSERARQVELRPTTRETENTTSADPRALRAVSMQIREVEADHGDVTELRSRHDELRAALAGTSPQSSDRSHVGESADPGHTLVTVLDDGRHLFAVRGISPHGPAGERLHELGPSAPMREAASTAASLLSVAARTGRDISTPLSRTLSVLDDQIGRILRSELRPGDRLGLCGPGWLSTVPWRLVPALSGIPVAIVPSTQWLTNRVEPATPSAHQRALVVAGPNLAHADAEVDAVASAYDDATVLTGSAATPDAVLKALPHASTLHVVAHGHLDRGNPEWSSLELWGGSVTVNELRSSRHTPSTVILSACHTGPQTGDDLLGFAGALFSSGTQTVVASSGPLPDSPRTVSTMASFHRRLDAGDTPSTALQHTFATGPDQCAVSKPDAVVNGLLVCLGVA